jgi:hypothetical protein
MFAMSECTDIFWREFYKGAGVMLGVVLPLLLGFGTMMMAVFRQQQHDERMQDARLEAERLRQDHYRVVRGGQG